MDYRISGERLKGFADQVRRISGVEGELTPEQMETNLLNVTPLGEYPKAEESAFGAEAEGFEFGITSINEDDITTYGSQSRVVTTMKVNEAVSIVGLRFYTKAAAYTAITLCNSNDEELFVVPTTIFGSSKQNVWNEFYCDTPINFAVGETFKLKSEQSVSTCVNLSDVEINAKLQYVSSTFQNDNSNTRLHGLIDVVLAPVQAELPDDYQIQRTTMDDIAEEVQRLTGTTEKLTTAQIISGLNGVTGGGLAPNEKKYQFADIESGVDASKIILETAISAVLQEV